MHLCVMRMSMSTYWCSSMLSVAPFIYLASPFTPIVLTRARVVVSATFAMVGGGKMTPPPSNSKTRKTRRPDDTAIDSS